MAGGAGCGRDKKLLSRKAFFSQCGAALLVAGQELMDSLTGGRLLDALVLGDNGQTGSAAQEQGREAATHGVGIQWTLPAGS